MNLRALKRKLLRNARQSFFGSRTSLFVRVDSRIFPEKFPPSPKSCACLQDGEYGYIWKEKGVYFTFSEVSSGQKPDSALFPSKDRYSSVETWRWWEICVYTLESYYSDGVLESVECEIPLEWLEVHIAQKNWIEKWIKGYRPTLKEQWEYYKNPPPLLDGLYSAGGMCKNVFFHYENDDSYLLEFVIRFCKKHPGQLEGIRLIKRFKRWAKFLQQRGHYARAV